MKLILCGGGSGEQNYFANEKLNEIINHDKPLLYIPLAMDEEKHPYDGCYEWISSELSDVNISNIEMVRTFEELANKNYYDYCALYIGGGNTYKLLKGFKESNAFNKINDYIKNDGIIIGGSAGAVIFGYDINIISVMDSNDVGLKDTKGFDALKGISIFPHYTNIKSKLSEEENKKRHNLFTESIIDFSLNKGDVIAIPEEDAIYVDDDNIEMLGTKNYYECKNGIIKEFQISKKER